MAGFFSGRMIEFLKKRLPPEKVHSIVIWTKTPGRILKNRQLLAVLRSYDQCFFHVTISGMGGTFLEPGIPGSMDSLHALSQLTEFTGHSGRIRVRFDPIVHLRLPDGRVYSNIDLFPVIGMHVKNTGLNNLIVSWMEPYPKVLSRLKKRKITPVDLSEGQLEEEKNNLLNTANDLKIDLAGCCVPGWPVSRCIDGTILTALHPGRLEASIQKAGAQRIRCGCTKSWDIGWYYPCPGGCIYCYANPLVHGELKGNDPVAEKEHLLEWT
ncbi:DUF1848 family protein [bacterium]|nr:DUF1848 family protein [bacterium]